MTMASQKPTNGTKVKMRVSIGFFDVAVGLAKLTPNQGIWTQLALAYAVHKSFIFLRVPLTAAVTPKVVKTLRGWGWDIGKRRPKGIKDVKKD